MAPTTLLTLIALWASVAASASNQITWGTVVFTYHGEKIPYLAADGSNITPYGANQLIAAGQAIRDRYVSPPVNASRSAPINGLNPDAIDNSQISILSTDDEFISTSAMAFMQAVYPPRSAWIIDSESILSNKSLEQFPLNGYQYPNIETVGSLDFNYIWIAGNEDCTTYSIAQVEDLSSPDYNDLILNTSTYYQSLAPTIFADLNPDIVNYGNAYDLYEYALYQYNHNITIFESISTNDMANLRSMASQQQFEMNTPNSSGNIASIAGQTFASVVLQQFDHIIASSGVSDKMTLLFGSFEPFLAFFALSNLSVGPAAQRFTSLPEHGSIMAFELYSYPASAGDNFNTSTPFPSTEDLWVRFLFQNGSSDNSLTEYPLFGRGNSEVDMTWSDFMTGMGGFSLNEVADWCSVCESVNLFCEAIASDLTNSTGSSTNNGDGKKGLSPVIGGVIGATVTIALFVICAIVMVLFGFRLDYHEKRAKGVNASDVGGIAVLKRNGSGGGGFKGAEKLASDTDLTLKGGAGASVIRHERVGSWELNESPVSPTSTVGKHSSLDKEIESGRVVSKADYGRNSEDGLEHVNPFGDPVKAVDQV